MDNKDIEKIAPKAKTAVSMSFKDIPTSVHKKILKFKRLISGRDNRDYNVKEAYRQFIIEKSKDI
jgi:hypothetical protein